MILVILLVLVRSSLEIAPQQNTQFAWTFFAWESHQKGQSTNGIWVVVSCLWSMASISPSSLSVSSTNTCTRWRKLVLWPLPLPCRSFTSLPLSRTLICCPTLVTAFGTIAMLLTLLPMLNQLVLMTVLWFPSPTFMLSLTSLATKPVASHHDIEYPFDPSSLVV